MPLPSNNLSELLQSSELKPQHFADLVRVAQLIADPSGGLSGREMKVDWESFRVSAQVVENLRSLGQKYQFSSPHIKPDILWNELTSETRTWFIENKNLLTDLEESFPARDED
jgi:hypothetical protein